MSGSGDRASLRRVEDARFLRGEGCFVDDLASPDTLAGWVLRSPHGHARILSVDVTEAAASPGVVLILTAADLARSGLTTVPLDLPPPGRSLADMRHLEQPILAGEEVRYVGDPVAFVVARDAASAQAAAERIVIDYEDLPAVCDLRDAARNAASVWSDGRDNVVFAHVEGDPDAVGGAFASASRVVRCSLAVNRVDALALEPRGCVAEHDPDTGTFTLHVSTQRVHVLQRALADRVFHVPRHAMRVVAPDTGGGFGQKNGLYPEYVLCLEAARRTGRPVKWIATRSEGLASDNHGRDNHFEVEAALDASHRILAVRVLRLMSLGAYTSPRSMVPALNGLTHLTGVYHVGAASAEVRGVLTSAAPTCPYRGAGRPESVFCCERMMDLIARALGVDPVAFRRMNLLDSRAMPWTSPLGTRFDLLDFEALLDRALDAAQAEGFARRRAASEAIGRRRGLGVALYAEDLHGSEEPVTARLRAESGSLALLVGTGSAGHGHETSFLQIVSERLHIPVDRLIFRQSDTASIPDGVGTAASWSITLGGSSAALAADAAIIEARTVAARLLGASSDLIEFSEGWFRAAGSNEVLGWGEILAAEPDFDVRAAFTGHGSTVNGGCHVCEVEIDPETGEVAITAFTAAHDFGRLVNPMLVEGQVHGGVAQGVGQAWMEEISYDPSGQLISGSMSDYAIPRAGDLPSIEVRLMETPSVDNPLGVRGMGEAAATGSTPAFVNAVLDALAPLGIDHIDPPATSAKIWRAVEDAERSRRNP